MRLRHLEIPPSVPVDLWTDSPRNRGTLGSCHNFLFIHDNFIMIASILACPKCNSLVMEDTVICPNCQHVLKPEQAEMVQELVASTPKFDGSQEISCRECGAMNRQGQVRCWQCGAFMKEDMERVYLAMQARPAEIISSHELSVEPFPASPSHPGSPFANADQYDDEDEDDFDLAEEIPMYDAALMPAPDEEADQPDFASFNEELEQDSATAEEVVDATAEDDDEADAEEQEDLELLKLAKREERELNRQSAKRKRAAGKGTFLIKGPCGDCKIRVQKYHQGMMGQCPKCSLPFMVPILKQDEKKSAAKQETPTTLPESEILEGPRWHEILLSKFKPKQDALAKQGQGVDLIRRPAGIVVVWPLKKGTIGANAKQLEKGRNEIRTHLAQGAPLDKLPAPRHELLAIEQLLQARIIQPVLQEDFTGGQRLFGPGMIGLEIPAPPPVSPEVAEAAEAASSAAAAAQKFSKKKPAKPKKPKVVKPKEQPALCLVLTLSQYRKLRGWLAEWAGQPDFLTAPGIPLEDTTQTWKCALSEQEFEALDGAEWFESDASRPVTTVGWLCQCATIAISETARAEQKFGGKKPVGLAKTKCPQCDQKFGCQALVHLTSVVAPPPPPEAPAEKEGTEKSPKQAKSTETPASDSKAPATEQAVAETSEVASPAESTAQAGQETSASAAEKSQPAEKKEPGKKLFGFLSRKK